MSKQTFGVRALVELDFGHVEEGKWWTVRAENDRYVILTMPAKKSRTWLLYTVIDWERNVRGPINLIGGGWDIQEDTDYAEKLAELVDGEVEVSWRNNVPVLVTELEGL